MNGNNQGVQNSWLLNLSVAASDWTLDIDKASPFNHDLDLSKIEDIRIDMDSPGIALPGREAAAAEDSRALQARFAESADGAGGSK